MWRNRRRVDDAFAVMCIKLEDAFCYAPRVSREVCQPPLNGRLCEILPSQLFVHTSSNFVFCANENQDTVQSNVCLPFNHVFITVL